MTDLKKISNNLKNIFKRELAVLWVFSVLLGFALVALAAKDKLPLGAGDFAYVAILTLCIALYRPRWAFFLFIGLIPLENVILVSGFLPIQLRPYQFVGGITVAAIAILWASKKLKFDLLSPNRIDWLVFSLIPLSFLSLTNAPDKGVGLKNNLILLSFVVLFWLVRNFLRSREDIVKAAFFFGGSYAVTAAYGYYQVFADKFGARSFEVMFGRPNATFTEPDWLGIYLCLALAVFLAAMFFVLHGGKKLFVPKKYAALALDILVFLTIALIILTLSRSAWVGAAAPVIFYLLLNLYEKKGGGVVFTPRKFARELVVVILIVAASLAAVHFGKLSKFDIFDRARSAATSEQKITVACENGENIPQSVSDTGELAGYGCRHINLEEIGSYKSQEKIVTEIFRSDPNILTRSDIYRKSFAIVKAHPVLGIGFGTITQALGADSRGAGLNESNIFLQVWAGSGIPGLIAFSVLIAYLFMYSLRRISPYCPMNKFFGCPVAGDNFKKTLHAFAVLGILALIVPNLVNAGLFMGILWFGLAFIASIR